ncbi:MAG: hypothetical protein DMG14_33335 [Acidobacteria bacterium]|nr:MAG: hypothetical protein DMG14_33335 [Acidobacteriota bacterium]
MKTRLIVTAILGMSVYAFAQFGGRTARTGQFGGGRFAGEDGGQTGGRCLVPGYFGSGEEDLPTPRKINRSGFVYARARYHLQPWWRLETREVPWHHDYPDGDTMFPTSLGRLTTVWTDPESYQIVDIDSNELFQYPFIYMSEPGYLNLLPGDIKNLREYLDRGGFLLMDDFRGNEFDNSQFQNMRQQMKKLFPDRELSLVPPTHPIFHLVYDLDEAAMLPPYRMFNSGDVQFFGISDAKGRLQVMIDFNNDISEYWQALDVGQCSIHEAGTAVELGVNYAVYALTH